MRKCPFCAEEIQDAAVLCRFCQHALPAEPSVASLTGPGSVAPRPAAKWIGVLVGIAMVAFVGLVLLAFVVDTPPPKATTSGAAIRPALPPTPAPARSWQAIAQWRGNGIKQTETFRTTSGEWRVFWKTANELLPNSSIIQIYVYDGGGNMVSLAANKQGVGSDTSYVRSPPGAHYLMINSANVDWHVRVEEER